MHEIELNYFQLNRKRKLDVITTYSNLTNKQLSLKAKCSISTIKRLKQKLRNAKLCKKEVNLAHGNQWGDRKKIYSNDLIINKGLDNSSNNTIYISVDDTYFNTKQNKNKVSKFRTRIINFFMLDKNKNIINKNHFF
ncbi:hypothetical protein ACWXVO_03075, partial [Mycoplasma sp. 1890]